MKSRIFSLLFALSLSLLCIAQESTSVSGTVKLVSPTGLVLSRGGGNDVQITLGESVKVWLMTGQPSLGNRTAVTLGDVAIGDTVLAAGDMRGGTLSATRLMVTKQVPAGAGTDTANTLNRHQLSLEEQALQRLNGGTAASQANSSAQPASSGSDLESRALQAMQTNTVKAEAEKQRQEQAAEQRAAEAAAVAAAAPPPDPPVSTAATFLNGLSDALATATANMQQQTAQQQAQFAQQQQQRLAMIQQQQAAAAAARLRQQQATDAARQQQQQMLKQSTTTANGSNQQIVAKSVPPAATGTGVSGPPSCVYVGGTRGCVPMAEWQAEQQAAAAATKNPVVSSDGTAVCPLNGHITKGHYAACDVFEGMDYSCTPGLKVSIYDGLPNAKGCAGPTTASVQGSAGTSSGSPGAVSGTGTGDNSVRNTIAPGCTAVDGEWVQNTTFKTKKDLWLKSLCSGDVSVNWFLGRSLGQAGSLHGYEDTSATGNGVYPGDSMKLSIYVCPIDYPVPVKSNGDKVDGHGQPYSCARGTAPAFMATH